MSAMDARQAWARLTVEHTDNGTFNVMDAGGAMVARCTLDSLQDDFGIDVDALFDGPPGDDMTTATDTPSVALEAEQIINGARRDAYGPVEESFARIAAMWTAYMNTRLATPLTGQDVAALMILLKVSRESGGVHHRDNLVDVCGYALLWDRLAETAT